jgi:thiol-disulfide isomerase/thioredoxin
MITALAITLVSQFPMNTKVPEFIGSEWFNAEKPITMASRKGKVTLVHFWTFACYNCKNDLPALKRLTSDFKSKDVVTIGIHTPEIEIEKDIEQVKKNISKLGITYPVLIDGDYKNWKAWKNQVWPTLYVLDKEGKLRGGWIGEMNYNNQGGEEKMRKLINQLLAEK